MFCPKCGRNLLDGSGFCSACGNPIAKSAAQPAAPQPVYTQPTYAPPQPVYAQQSLSFKQFYDLYVSKKSKGNLTWLLVTKHWVCALLPTVDGDIWSVVNFALGGTPSGIVALIVGIATVSTRCKTGVQILFCTIFPRSIFCLSFNRHFTRPRRRRGLVFSLSHLLQIAPCNCQYL